MRGLPALVENDIVRRLYGDAQRLDWVHLSMSERRRQYSAWLAATEVGGVLMQFLSREGARVWIKDGPMKEFARATAGLGRFAALATQTGLSASEMTRLALGADWELVEDSVGVKPLQSMAVRSGTFRFLCWGPPKDFKHLLWAALRAAEFDGHVARVVVVERIGNELRSSERKRFERLCARCGLEFVAVRLA